ncbi:MAG: ATP-binding protein [Potamolinea sp.]
MAKLGQSSFRRILLSRLFLLSVPVLLAGMYVTYRKARTTLLETARQNLKESAVSKGERIIESIAGLKSNLVTASETVALQSQSLEEHQQFISKLARQLPTQIQCVQLTDIPTKKLIASSCGDRSLTQEPTHEWFQQIASLPKDHSEVDIRVLLPQKLPTSITNNANQINLANQLKVVLGAPVYDYLGQLKYALSFESVLLEQQKSQPGSLSGYTVVINEPGTILTHPDRERVGRNIKQEAEVKQLQYLLDKAIAGQQNYQHLFSFENNSTELVAGYTSIKSPITTERNQKWAILAITSIDSALAGLKDIQQALFLLTCCLIAASLLATVYIARDLARPLEKLRDYALQESELHSTGRIPHNFKIREINQLSEALEGMIARMRHWAEELETAWKEAQTANQLKNEFLANTSHELRTPLNGIIGCLRLVRDGFCDDREEELDFLQRADDAAIHLLGIINDVLDIAKIEAGKLSVEIEPVDLRKLLNEVINLQAVPIQQKDLEFITSDLHEVIAVYADPAKLKQVLLNVVGNAVKFTDAGSITISTRLEPTTAISQPIKAPVVSSPINKSLSSLSSSLDGANQNCRENKQEVLPLVSQDQENRDHLWVSSQNSSTAITSLQQVVITVKDTGIGIDPEQQHKLFRPFVMVDGSTTRKVGGTGLGLAISRNLIELMGGRITLFSEGEEQGTIVEITMPTIEPSLLLSVEVQKSSDETERDNGRVNNDNLEEISESSQVNSPLLTDISAVDLNGSVKHSSRPATGEN